MLEPAFVGYLHLTPAHSCWHFRNCLRIKYVSFFWDALPQFIASGGFFLLKILYNNHLPYREIDNVFGIRHSAFGILVYSLTFVSSSIFLQQSNGIWIIWIRSNM